MYTKRIQIINYGPIPQLDIQLPFCDEVPKPVVVVGQNGSGKSIFLSHIVNGLVSSKDRAYPDTPEIEPDRVFKVRSSSYIGPAHEWCYARVDFERNFCMGELTTRRRKSMYEEDALDFPSDDVKRAWDEMESNRSSHLISNLGNIPHSEIVDIFAKSAVQFFPHNRFEEPAWLNEEHLNAQADHMTVSHTINHTTRRLINYASLLDNQNWLYDLAFDSLLFDRQEINSDRQDNSRRLWTGYSGESTRAYGTAMDVIRVIMQGNHEMEVKIGHRLDRFVSLWKNNTQVVRSFFQLSSGETSLLNIFLSILRDFDLSEGSFAGADEVRGIVVVDEVDLHLHANHQYEVLPSLMKMFPKVQFIVTSHSPLFVLGMSNVFGENGFALYRLPDGQQISPEEFSEFDQAYRSFSQSEKFNSDVRQAIVRSQDPLVFMEGITDVRYVQRAAEHLGYESLLSAVNLDQAGSSSILSKIWNTMRVVALTTQEVLLIYDSDAKMAFEQSGGVYRRSLPFFDEHPVKKGIENLFARETLERARSEKAALIDTASEQVMTVRGEEIVVPESWSINKSEKTNLCNWLCENGTTEDFRHFKVIFDFLSEFLEEEPATQS